MILLVFSNFCRLQRTLIYLEENHTETCLYLQFCKWMEIQSVNSWSSQSAASKQLTDWISTLPSPWISTLPSVYGPIIHRGTNTRCCFIFVYLIQQCSVLPKMCLLVTEQWVIEVICLTTNWVWVTGQKKDSHEDTHTGCLQAWVSEVIVTFVNKQKI